MVDSTQAPEKRESAPKGKVQSITDAKFPVYCSNRRSAGPSEKVATPATECEVELLKGRRSSNSSPKEEFERTQVTKTEEKKERGGPSPRHQALAW